MIVEGGFAMILQDKDSTIAKLTDVVKVEACHLGSRRNTGAQSRIE